MPELIPVTQVTPDAEERPAIEAAITRVMDSGRYILGDEVAAFEREWASYCGARHCVGVASGTDALKLLLYGLPRGSRVLTPANTAPPTYTAIREAGLEPFFSEIGADGLLDPEILPPRPAAERVTALLPVHLYGRMCRMAPLVTYAQQHGLRLIEDACQAHGAKDSDGVRPGERSLGAAYSFYPTKNLGALGDGGAIVTNDPDLAEQARRLRGYGYVEPGTLGAACGYNSRLDEMQAAILRARLPHLDRRNALRQVAFKTYRAIFAELIVPYTLMGGGNVHLLTVRVARREEVRKLMRAMWVDTGVHYPVPGHRQRPFALHQTSLPVTEAWCNEIVTLPLWPGMDEPTVRAAVEALRRG